MNTPLRAFLAELHERWQSHGGIQFPEVSGAAWSYLSAAAIQGRRGPVVVVTPDESGRQLFEEVKALLVDSTDPAWFPPPDTPAYEGLPCHPGILLSRSLALCRIVSSNRPIVFLPVESLLWKAPLPGWWKRNLILLEEGEVLDRQELRLQAWKMGYRRVDLVSDTGELSIRGGITDLFPPGESLPVRAELFGDEVDTLRFFDPTSQRSLGPVGRSVCVPPLSEAIQDEELLKSIRTRLRAEGSFGEVRLESLEQDVLYPSFHVEMRAEAAFFGPFWLYLPKALWIWRDREGAVQAARNRLRSWVDEHESRERPEYLAPSKLFATPEDLPEEALGETQEIPPWLREVARPRLFPGEPVRLFRHLKECVDRGERALLLLQGHGTLERLSELAAQEGIVLHRECPDSPVPPGIYADLAPAQEGVTFPSLGWTVVTEKEIFGRGRVTAARSARRRDAFFANLRDLKVGDYVVHVEHGIGRYKGIETMERGSLREDFMILHYAGQNRLFVPVQRMDLVQKYVGPEGHHPALDRLGGPAWQKAKARVRKAVRELAQSLLRLYAKRRTIEKTPLPSDTEWQLEFEEQFPHELTPDQALAIQDVKRDMESHKPMDRLVCGDVGFGKTEVAMRAAFKAAADGRQVAILCPTTVLALQHMERFSERFAPFPFRIRMISRFVLPREQKALAAETARGEVDILIGTHRLLSKDVSFPRLGLLVVDEEQRFGVAHKEKIKQLRANVDVLTLTATPIPRTLQMGLSSIMEVSLIQTPPKDRLSIQTILRPMDKELVASAIRRELFRGGQVFYVHNKVESIGHTAHTIKAWVPQARVVIAHGQMGERALEDVITAFFRGEYDILVCTTIIENGIDLPRANTLIVESAHTFGLSQLYQLRGRIGRSDVLAYAYLLTPEGSQLSPDAARRLETLREFTELGSGFRVAAVDLELRGAGDFLGAEQSGHMASVGFELYLQMLEEAVQESRGEAPEALRRCEMNLGLDLSIPMEYIEDINQRLSVYRDLSLAVTPEEVDAVESSLRDRYGNPPSTMQGMLEAVRIRIRAERRGILSIRLKEKTLSMVCGPDASLEPSKLVGFLSKRAGIRIDPSGSLEISLSEEESSTEFLTSFFKAVPADEGR